MNDYIAQQLIIEILILGTYILVNLNLQITMLKQMLHF